MKQARLWELHHGLEQADVEARRWPRPNAKRRKAAVIVSRELTPAGALRNATPPLRLTGEPLARGYSCTPSATIAAMSDAPRRWFRFRIRTLLLLTLLAVIGLSVYSYWSDYSERVDAAGAGAALAARGAYCTVVLRGECSA